MTSYPGAPRTLNGSFVILESAGAIGMVPRMIPFQFNPASITRMLTPFGSEEQTESQNHPFDPKESFELALILDASDALENPDDHPVSAVVGVAHKIAAFEQLLYPIGENFVGSGNINTAMGGVETKKQPVVLFVWGPSRIVPIKLKSFSVEEQIFSPTLYPIRAVVKLGCAVLTPEAFGQNRTPQEELAIAAYKFTMAQKELLAFEAVGNVLDELANLGGV